MSDQGNVEILAPVDKPFASSASGETKGREQDINVDRARDCLRQLKEIAKKNGLNFGLAELRKAEPDELFAIGDSEQNKKPGMLFEAGWKDDESTREFLANAQRYAEQQAEFWLQKIQSELGLSLEQLAESSLEEIINLASRKGMMVDVSTTDPQKRTEAEETLDNLRNAWEKAKERGVLRNKEEENGSTLVDEIKALDSIRGYFGELTGEAQSVMMIIIAHGVDNPEVYIELGQRLSSEILRGENGEEINIDTFLEKGDNLSEGQRKEEFQRKKHDLALALDLEIVGLQEQLSQMGNKNGKNIERIKSKIEELQAKRNQLTINERGEELVIPDQIKNFAAMFGCNDLKEVRALFEQAASYPERREKLLEFIEAGFNQETANIAKNILTNVNLKQEIKKEGNLEKNISILTLLMLLILAWRAFRANKQGEGIMG